MFTKNSVDLPDSMISLARCITPMMSGSPWSLSRRTESSQAGGLSTSMSKSRCVSCLRTVTSLRVPTRNLATLSTLPTVADNPMRWYSPASRDSLSRATLSWAPLSVLDSSWISSTTTHCTPLRCSLSLFPVNMTWRVSGVVMRISGGFWDWWFLSAWDVSPWRTPTVMWSALPYSSILRSMSLLRARSGVMYRHLNPERLPLVR